MPDGTEGNMPLTTMTAHSIDQIATACVDATFDMANFIMSTRGGESPEEAYGHVVETYDGPAVLSGRIYPTRAAMEEGSKFGYYLTRVAQGSGHYRVSNFLDPLATSVKYWHRCAWNQPFIFAADVDAIRHLAAWNPRSPFLNPNPRTLEELGLDNRHTFEVYSCWPGDVDARWKQQYATELSEAIRSRL